MIRRFARPYARAFMEVIPSPAEAQKAHDELARFESLRRGSAELSEVFASPSVESAAKMNIARTVSSRIGLSALGTKMIEVLVNNHRINDLGSVLEAWQALIHSETGVAVAQVRTAHPLDAAESDKLRQSLEQRFGRKIELRLSVDPSLLGGFIATVESDVYDASINGQIHKIRQSIV